MSTSILSRYKHLRPHLLQGTTYHLWTIKLALRCQRKTAAAWHLDSTNGQGVLINRCQQPGGPGNFSFAGTYRHCFVVKSPGSWAMCATSIPQVCGGGSALWCLWRTTEHCRAPNINIASVECAKALHVGCNDALRSVVVLSRSGRDLGNLLSQMQPVAVRVTATPTTLGHAVQGRVELPRSPYSMHTPVSEVPEGWILVDLRNVPFSMFRRLQISDESGQPILVRR